MNNVYEENLWGKVNFLHERYHNWHKKLSNLLDIISRFQNACVDFSKSLTNNLRKNSSISEDINSTINNALNNFNDYISHQSIAYSDISESIKTKININQISKMISESYQKEKEMFNHYSKCNSIYKNNKTLYEKIQNDFRKKAKECENLVYQAKKAKIYSLASPDQINKMEMKASNSINNARAIEDKYAHIVTESNKSRENEIKAQKDSIIIIEILNL